MESTRGKRRSVERRGGRLAAGLVDRKKLMDAIYSKL